MSGIKLLDSQKSEERNFDVSSWGESNTDKDEVSVHMFENSSNSGSINSLSSYEKKIEQKRVKKSQETSFILQKKLMKKKIEVILNENEVNSSSNHLQESSSSETKSYSPKSPKNLYFSNAKKDYNITEVNDTMFEKDNCKLKKNETKIKKSLMRSDNEDKNLNTILKSTEQKCMISPSEQPLREKIRDRFNAVKEQYVESISPHLQLPSRKKSLILKHEEFQLKNLLKEEESEISAAIKRHEKMKKYWQEISKTSLEKKSWEESYLFFTEKNEHNSSCAISLAEETKSSSNIEGTIENLKSLQTEESKMLTSEFLDLREDNDLIEWAKPKVQSLKIRNMWEKNLFYPLTTPVKLENKIEPGLVPRHIEEEGIYVGLKLKIPKKIKNKVEQRLTVTQNGRKWFGNDGELLSLTCPLKIVSTRPCFDEDNIQISSPFIFKPPVPGDLDRRFMDPSENLNYVLEIEISLIEFTHHPLFSREHVLAQRLKELYVKYKKRSEMKHLERLTGRLNALRKTRDNMKVLLNAGGDNLNLKEKLQKYENSIKEIRQMRYIEGRIDKELIQKIILTWKDLLKLREKQGYQSTQVKLNIKKKFDEGVNEKKIKWESDIKQDTLEIIEELEQRYESELQIFEKKHDCWQRSKFKKQNTTEHEGYIEKLSDSESSNELDSEWENFIEAEPKPPQLVKAEEVKAQVLKNYKESFNEPEEPEIQFIMSSIENMNTSSCNNNEELRKTAIKRCMVFVKLFYNGKEVCRSQPQPLSQNFRINFCQKFSLRILEWPESLMVEIHEESKTLNRNILVPGIYLPFPDPLATIENSEFTKHEFSSNISVTYHHAGVGSGNKLIICPDGSDFNNKPLCLFTSGTIAYRVGWMYNERQIMAPPGKYLSIKREEPATSLCQIIKSGGFIDISNLKEWAENSKLDPNDPFNSSFFHFLGSNGDIVESKSYFRLNPLLNEFDFCKEDDIENNSRLKLLSLRNSGEPEFRYMKMVPLNEKLIKKEIFEEFEKRSSKPHYSFDVLTSDSLNAHRIWGQKYLEEVQQKLMKQLKTSRQSKRQQDVIIEESVPNIRFFPLLHYFARVQKKSMNDFRTLGLTFMKWLRPRRPLHPVRKERKKVTPQNFSGQEINLIVNVVRAFEVPVRKDVDNISSCESIDGFSLVNVRPFVEVTFQGVTAKTTAAEGANPTWNQDLRIPLTNNSEQFRNGSIQSIRDNLYLYLYDETIVDLIEDETARETNIHQRLERHWLASMKIPFSSLYLNSRIEGTFKLYSPPVLLGYEREAHRRQESINSGFSPPQRDATYITLFITVQPALNPPKLIKEKMECSEMESLKKHLEGWQQEITNMFSHRKVKTLVLDTSGKTVCVTRFVKPLPPPQIFEEKTTPEMAARFVALIPSASETLISSEHFDVWLTCDQVLRLICGNPVDHAILLCSYFLHFGFTAYILIGTGIPHGPMAYVLVHEKVYKNSEYFIWDPTSGQKYNVHDSFCPLQKIYCVVSSQNIWANIQNEEMPRRTQFDLSRRADWLPAFGKNVQAPLESVQPESLQYITTSRHAINALQDKIEKTLRDNIMKWRKKSRTIWNRYCAATLRRLLPKLEESTWNLTESHSPDHISELQHILASHKMCGFPINITYTDVEAVIEAVKATGIHCNETEGVEFALAVFIYSYPNDILSVWVYLASLIRRR